MEPQQLIVTSQSDIQEINYNVTDEALSVLKEKNSKLLLEWDGKDFEPLKASKREVLKLRTSIEPKRKEYNAAALEHQRKVNAEAKRIVEALESIEKPLDDILDAEKARVEAEKQAKIKAEQHRVETIKKQIGIVREMPFKCMNKPSQYVEEVLKYLTNLITSDDFQYEELTTEADSVKQETLAKLQNIYDERMALERRMAEEAAAAETRKQAQLAEDARLAEERRRLAEDQARIKAEQQKLNEEQEKLRLEKEADEKRKFEEARPKEPEEQKLASTKGITFTIPTVSLQTTVIIPASNEEEKINTTSKIIDYDDMVEAVVAAMRPLISDEDMSVYEAARAVIKAIQNALPNITPTDEERICDSLRVYNQFKNLGRQ